LAKIDRLVLLADGSPCPSDSLAYGCCKPLRNAAEARMHRLVQKAVKLDAGAKIVAVRERALLAHVKARAEFLWEGWVRHEHRWELGLLVRGEK
jgi:hypothetical protein